MKTKIFFVVLTSLFFFHSAFADEPTINGATDIIVTATSSVGAYVTFNVTASDTDTTTLVPTCEPPSGSLFALGTTTVTCTATSTIDTASTTSTTFNVGTFLNLSSETSVDVPASCNATDTDGVLHTYEASSPDLYIGICALEAALVSSSISNVELSNQYPSIGLFVTAIAGVSADPNSQYWALYQNGNYASVGLALLPVSVGDTITFQLQDFSGDNLGDQVTLDIHSLVSTSTDSTDTQTNTQQNTESDSGGNSGGGAITHNNVNVPNAINFLESNESPDGSFSDSSLYTDWAAISFAADGTVPPSLKNYELTSSPALSGATDFERHTMALEALGINPYSGTGVNYIQDIINEFDGTQIGDPSLVNDDIFSTFPLIKAGYSSSDNIIQKVIESIISKQNSDGSWNESVDLTAAAIQALKLTESISGVSQSIAKARTYLVSEQKAGGGFGSDDSTSWALQAIAALGESSNNWLSGGYNPNDYLYSLQQNDGGIGNSSENLIARVWSTSFAIPAALGKPWAVILNSFPKPAAATFVAAAGTSGVSVSVATSTNTSPAATSSIPIATSTAGETVMVSGAKEMGFGERVVEALRTSEPKPISVATTSTSTLSQVAAVAASQNANSSSNGFTVILETVGSIVAVGGIYLLLIL